MSSCMLLEYDALEIVTSIKFEGLPRLGGYMLMLALSSAQYAHTHTHTK